jgi:type I restriction enzyme R subunit
MTDFKQIIGRGTRVRDDYGKFYFNILDYTGSATRRFADPDFDGESALITEEHINDEGHTIPKTYEIIEDHSIAAETEESFPIVQALADDSERQSRKFYFDGGQVEIAAHLVYELDPDGNQLSVIKFIDYAADKVRTLYPSAVNLKSQWANPEQRSEIIEKLAERGIDFDELAQATRQLQADPFDLLCHIAFNAPLRTRRERADRLRKEKKDFFDNYSQEAQTILNELLEKYAEHGTAQFLIPDVLKIPPISEHGNVVEIANLFGGADQLREAIHRLQTLLYAA